MSLAESSVEDPITNALSTLAHSTRVGPAAASDAKRTSRFWFRINAAEQVVKRSKKSMAKKEVEHIDVEVEKRLHSYRKEMPDSLKGKMAEVREFFLTEIAPLTLASSGGNLQSKEVVQRLLDTEVDTAIFAKFENMVNRAATIKLALFTLDYFSLPKDYLSSLLGQTPSEFSTLSSKIGETLASVASVSREQSKIKKSVATKADLVTLAKNIKAGNSNDGV